LAGNPENGWGIFDEVQLREVDNSAPPDHLQVVDNGGEDVAVVDLRCVLGKATGWDYDDGIGSIGNDANFDDYLSVLGRFRVTTFGTHSNEYVLNLRDIATWEQT
jgi:hypothetical protein